MKNNTSNGELLVHQEPRKSNTFLYVILLFMASLFGAIIFVPQEEFGEAIFTCFFLFLLILSELHCSDQNLHGKLRKLRKEKKDQPHIGLSSYYFGFQ